MLTIWLFARAYLRPHRARFLALGALVVGGTAMQLAGPLILRRFVDEAAAKAPLAGMAALAAAYCLLTAVQQAVAIADACVATDLAMRATNRVRLDLFDRCLRLDPSFHETNPPGALIQRIDRDPAMLDEVLSHMAVTVASNGLLIAGVIVLIFLVDWRVGLALAACAAAAGIIRLGTSGRITRAWLLVRGCTADLYGFVEEALGAADDLITAGAVPYAQRRLQRENRGVVRSTLRAILVDGVGGVGVTAFELGTTAALAVAVGLRAKGHLTVGDVFMVAAYGQLCLAPMQQLAKQVQDLQPAGAAAHRVREVLAAQPGVRWPADGRVLPDGALSVEMRGVRFSYRRAPGGTRGARSAGEAAPTGRAPSEDTGEAALDGIDFLLPPGAVLGLLGRTASGKSTLAKLLARFHDPGEGCIQVGGIDMRELSAEQLRRRVAYVAQDAQLVEGSLRDNLTLFGGQRSAAGDADLVEALRRVGLGEWLASAPDGLDTRLAAGAAMSAGEQQLVALARVFLLRPGLVILDEPSARIDPATEARLERAMRDLLRGRTAVVIAHRLETLEGATHVMVLEGGRVAEFDERSRLLAQPGSRYARLRRRAALGAPE